MKRLLEHILTSISVSSGNPVDLCGLLLHFGRRNRASDEQDLDSGGLDEPTAFDDLHIEGLQKATYRLARGQESSL